MFSFQQLFSKLAEISDFIKIQSSPVQHSFFPVALIQVLHLGADKIWTEMNKVIVKASGLDWKANYE